MRNGVPVGRSAGLVGLEATEVTLRGTMRSDDGFVAMLQGPDKKTYIVRVGDRLLDGTVLTISESDIVLLQVSTSPALESRREVRKALRQVEPN